MKTSIRFRLIAAICAATLLIGAFSFIPVPVQADDAGLKAAAAEKAVAKANALAEICRKLKEAADAAQKAADDAKKAADDAKKAADDAEKAADDAEKAADDAEKDADAAAPPNEADKAAKDAAKAADDAAKAADQAQAEAQKKQQEADAAKKAKEKAGDKGKKQNKGAPKSKEQAAADDAKDKANKAEDFLKEKEKESDAADRAAADRDKADALDAKNKDFSHAITVKEMKSEARRKRKAARAARRAAAALRREADAKQAEADAKQAEADAAHAAAAKPCRDAETAVNEADAALDRAEEALARKAEKAGKKPGKKNDEDKEELERKRKRLHPEIPAKPNEPAKSEEPKQDTVIPPSGGETVQTKTANGLSTVTFTTVQGRVIVNLPDEIRAGDTFSGTVIAEPKGQTKEERAKNQSELNGLVIEIDGKPLQYSPGTRGISETGIMETFSTALTNEPKVKPGPNEAPSSRPLQISLVNSAGKDLVQTTIPIWSGMGMTPSGAVITPDPKMTPTFNIPPLGQTGRPMVITGPFDGNASNTTLNATLPRTNVQDFEKGPENVSTGFGLLAESRSRAVFQSPTNMTGPIEITVKEGDKQTTGNYRNVGVNLSAPKTNLLKGDRTTLTVRVEGLKGITQDVPLRLEKRGVVTMQGGDVQTKSIKPNEVQADGSFTMTRRMTGQQAGAFSVTATVVVSAPGPAVLAIPEPQPPGGEWDDGVPLDMKKLGSKDLENERTISLGRLRATLIDLEARIKYSDEKSGRDSDDSKNLRKAKALVEEEIKRRGHS